MYLGGSESSDFTMILQWFYNGMSWIVNLDSESSSCSSFVKVVLIGAWSASVYCMNLQTKHGASQFNWPHSCLLSEDFLSTLHPCPCPLVRALAHIDWTIEVLLSFLLSLKCWWAKKSECSSEAMRHCSSTWTNKGNSDCWDEVDVHTFTRH